MTTVDVLFEPGQDREADRIQVMPQHSPVVYTGEEIIWRFHCIPQYAADSVILKFDKPQAQFFRVRPTKPRVRLQKASECRIDLAGGRGMRMGAAPELKGTKRNKYTIVFYKKGEEVGRLDPEIVTSWP